MGIFDDAFDLDGDGNITGDEKFMSMMMMQDILEHDAEAERRRSGLLDDEDCGEYETDGFDGDDY